MNTKPAIILVSSVSEPIVDFGEYDIIKSSTELDSNDRAEFPELEKLERTFSVMKYLQM